MRTLALTTALILAVLSLQVTAGDTSQGKEVFERRCAGCHSLDRDKEGPRLRGVYGRPSGTSPLFTYSERLKKAHIVWDADSLDRWLADPEALVPDNDMAFRLTNAAERKQLIAYLQQISVNR